MIGSCIFKASQEFAEMVKNNHVYFFERKACLHASLFKIILYTS